MRPTETHRDTERHRDTRTHSKRQRGKGERQGAERDSKVWGDPEVQRLTEILKRHRDAQRQRQRKKREGTGQGAQKMQRQRKTPRGREMLRDTETRRNK